MKRVRQEWEDMGCPQMSFNAPSEQKERIKTLVGVITGEHLMALAREGANPGVMALMAERRNFPLPHLPEVHDLRDKAIKRRRKVIKEELDRVEDLVREDFEIRRRCETDSMSDEEYTRSYALCYAISYYLKHHMEEIRIKIK